MNPNQLQELLNFVQATIQLDENEIKAQINTELKDKLNADEIEEFTKQVLEIKQSIKDGNIPDLQQ